MKKHLLFVAFTMLAAGTASAQGNLQVKTADGESPVRVLGPDGDLLALAERRPAGLLHPGLVLV